MGEYYPNLSKNNSQSNQKMNKKRIDIIFERIPPLLSWILITMPIWGGLLIPEITAYIVIFFNIYFLYKSISITFYIFISYINIRKTETIDWLKKLQELDNLDKEIFNFENKIENLRNETFNQEDAVLTAKDKLNNTISKRLPYLLKNIVYSFSKNKTINFFSAELKILNKFKSNPPFIDWNEIQHIIMIPHMKEPMHVLDDTIMRLKEMNYPTKKISIVLASEAVDPEGLKVSQMLKNKYKEFFNQIWITSHVLMQGELIGKSSNMAFASKEIYNYVKELGWDLKKVTITSCDADSQLPINYLANITYNFIIDADSQYRFYTAAVLLYANIWELPFFARVKNSMSTIYNVAKLARTDKLVPFSTYTTSFWLIKEIGFWSSDIIPEDFHTFSKALFMYPHKVHTVAIFLKVMVDAAEGTGNLDTLKNNYFQERRWAWGISDDGWLLKNILKSFLGRQDFSIRSIYIASHIVFDHIAGVGIALMVALGGYIPLLINRRFANTIFGFNLPIVSSLIINITFFFFIIMIIMDSFLKPSQKGKITLVKRFIYMLEWIVQPLTGILMVALPGFEAHTRLLFGKYLEYYLTKKK